ncbi:MAG: hypothetical protein JXA96_02640 [Sedimentisphaerales bacterium]|nr:hypothetical protein [Sedimentisphaerales bacterium]
MIFADYPGHLVAIAVLAIAAGIIFWAFRCSELQKGKYRFLRVFLIAIKFLTILILILILWNPSRSELVETISKNNVLVFFDTSESMSVAEKAGTTRLDNAMNIFEEKLHTPDNQEPEYKILGFDNDVYHSGSTQLLRRWGHHTNIQNIIETLGKYDKANTSEQETSVTNDSTKGAIIFTDGQADNQSITNYSPLMRGDFPIVIVGVGSRNNGTDVEIKTIKAPIKALVDSIYNVEVVAAANNLIDDSVTVELLKDNLVIDSVHVQADEFKKNDKQENQNVTLQFTVAADILGSHNLSARVKVIKDEVNIANNIQSTFVDVVENEELNILFYSQVAEFNVGKVRQVLSSDPRINLDFCLDAIRTVGRSSSIINKLGYAQLPETQEDFNKYDIIILGNFSADTLSEQQISGLYNFVTQRGGGLVMLPGRDDYGPAGWDNPQVKLLLPVIFNSNESKLWPPDAEQMELSPEGNYEIILPDEDIPYFNFAVSAYYNVDKVKPSSSILAASGNRPLIIIQRIGRGKVCLLNISKLFSWYREDKQGGWLYSLLSQLTSYLGQSPGKSAGLELFAERQNADENKVKFIAYVRDNNYSPVSQANVLLNLNNQIYSMSPSGSGYYITEIDNMQTDRIVASAQAEFGGIFLGEKAIAVNLPSRKTEMSDTRFNEQFLQNLAKQLNGTYIYSDDVDNELINSFDAQSQVGHTNRVLSIWPNWYLWGLICLLLSFEWFIRRAKGLV